MAKDGMTQMTVYVSVETKRRFKALCALEGVTLGGKIEQVVNDQEESVLHVPQQARRTSVQ
jgi:hypothetical protein